MSDQGNADFGKPWYASRTIWAGIFTIGSGIAGVTFGIHASAGDITQLVDSAAKIGEAASVIVGTVGGVVAIVGRLRASMPIVKK